MSNQNNIFTTNDLVEHYHDQGLKGEIKIYFKKSDIKTHNSKLDKPYYIIKPLVVKIGEFFDDAPKYSIFLKPKHYYRMNLIESQFWVLLIDDELRSFIDSEDKAVNFYGVTIKYITNNKLIDQICKKALSIHNIDELDEDEI